MIKKRPLEGVPETEQWEDAEAEPEDIEVEPKEDPEEEPDDEIKKILDPEEIAKEVLSIKDTDPLAQSVYQIFHAEIQKNPLLSAEQEKELAVRVSEGDIEAYRTFILSNLRLVIATAKKIQWRYGKNGLLDFMDLIQEGILGLIIAVQRFDPNFGTRFSTYGMFWIRQRVRRAILSYRHGITLPYHAGNSIVVMNSMIKKYHDGKIDEVPKKLRRRIRVLHRITGQIGSLDNSDEEKGEKIPGSFNLDRFDSGDISHDDEMYSSPLSPDEVVEEDSFREQFRQIAEEALSPELYEILSKRFGLPPYNRPYSLKDIGESLDKSQEYIRNQIDSAIKKLRTNKEMKRFFVSWYRNIDLNQEE